MNAISSSKPKQKTRRRPLVITGISLFLIIGSAKSANAILGLNKAGKILNSASKTTNTLKPILGKDADKVQNSIDDATNYVSQTQQYLNQLSSFYYNIIGGNLEGILGDIQGITGALGIPDPFAIRTEAEWNEQVPGTMTTAQAKANTTDRVIANAISSTVLGKDGQTVIREQQQQVAAVVQQSAQAAQSSSAAAQAAQSRNVTQDILKDVATQQAVMAQQQVALAQINQQMSGQLTGLQLQGAVGNLMLSNISGTLDQQEMQRIQAQQASNLSEAQTTAQIFIPGIKFAQ